MIISGFEIYTSYFRLGRLQKAADLLARIEDVNSKATNNPPELDKARKALISQAVEAITAKPITFDFIPTTLKISMDEPWKFFAGAAFWWLMAMFQIQGIWNKLKRPALVGLLLIGAVTGFLGLFIPSAWWPWFHIFALPWIFLFCIAIMVLPIIAIISKREADKKTKNQP